MCIPKIYLYAVDNKTVEFKLKEMRHISTHSEWTKKILALNKWQPYELETFQR